MALHGRIEVNGQPIGLWQARRREFVMPKGRPNTYDCAVTICAEARTVGFVIEHHYEDGAFALAAHVIKDAHALLGGRELP